VGELIFRNFAVSSKDVDFTQTRQGGAKARAKKMREALMAKTAADSASSSGSSSDQSALV